MKTGTFSIEVTKRCNFRCAYCPQTVSARKGRDMAPGLAVKLLSWAADTGLFSRVCFSSLGEPLLYPHLEEVVKAAGDRGFMTFLPTNGSLLTASRLSGLVDAGLDHLVLGINASCGKEFRRRGARPRFRDYMTNIRRRVREFLHMPCGGTVLILCYLSTRGMTVPRGMGFLPTFKDQQALAVFWKAFIRKHDLRPGQGRGTDIDRRVKAFFAREGEGLLTRLADRVYLKIRPLELSLSPAMLAKKTRLSPVVRGCCGRIENDLTVLSDGRVTFCTQKDYDGRIMLGDAEDILARDPGVLKKIQGLKKLNALGRLSAGQCQQCRALDQHVAQVTGTGGWRR